uniref:Palmitoyl-protein thioesterase n=1 Tax=Trepomonas sp. PC1 TaxID=1076344 RepID=A0A146K7I3_9EUKA|eukprot:JAP92338.1 Palmitoyl-protein thioesterase [Trepomonas sp. PC1]
MFNLIITLLDNLPIVYMHGLTQSASKGDLMLSYIKDQIPDAYILNCEVGNGGRDSIFMPIADQVEELATCINNDKMTHKGFIAFGYSQGGYLLRSYIQKYNHIKAPAKRFVGMANPLGGFFCGFHEDCYGFGIFPIIVQWLEPEIAYSHFMQNLVGPSNYWKDPSHMDAYIEGASHLPHLDNLKDYDEQQKINFMSVDQFILFGSPNDGAISPWKSAFFGFYQDDDTNIIDYWQRPDFHADNFGLKSMHNQGRIKTFISGLQHSEYCEPKAENFIKEQVAPWLRLAK